MSAPGIVEVGLVPVPEQVRSLLVFGGSFDPPTVAHIALPIEAARRLSADWLLYIPVGHSPLKERAPVAPAANRIGMLSAALSGVDRVSISNIETNRPGPSFTVETLSRLRSLLPSSTGLRLLIGADQAAEFHRWKEPHRIMELAEPSVMLRGGQFDRQSLLEAMRPHWGRTDMALWEHRLMDMPPIAASASEARALLAEAGPDHPRLRDLVPAPVLTYIREHGLYC